MLEYVGASLDHLGSAVLGEQVAVPGYHLSGSSIYYPSLYQVRGALLRQIRSFFEHCSKGGGGGGSNPCSKNMLQILYDLKGLLAT